MSDDPGGTRYLTPPSAKPPRTVRWSGTQTGIDGRHHDDASASSQTMQLLAYRDLPSVPGHLEFWNSRLAMICRRRAPPSLKSTQHRQLRAAALAREQHLKCSFILLFLSTPSLFRVLDQATILPHSGTPTVNGLLGGLSQRRHRHARPTERHHNRCSTLHVHSLGSSATPHILRGPVAAASARPTGACPAPPTAPAGAQRPPAARRARPAPPLQTPTRVRPPPTLLASSPRCGEETLS